jgi:hypothetical protein
MRFQVLTAASVKMIVFWAIAPCGVVEGPLEPDYTALYPRRLPSLIIKVSQNYSVSACAVKIE